MPSARSAPVLLSPAGLVSGPTGVSVSAALNPLSAMPALVGVPEVTAAPVLAAAPVLSQPAALSASALSAATPIVAPAPQEVDLEAARAGVAVLFDGSARLGTAELAAKTTPVEVETPERSEERYLDELLQRTRLLYRRFFPRFDVGFKVDMEFSRRADAGGTKGSHEVNPRKKLEVHKITLIEETAPSRSNEHERTLTPFSRNADKNPGLFNLQIQRWVSRTIALFHEYSHGVFHELTPAISRGFSMPDSDMLRVDLAAAMDEGFAVTMELLLIDRMIAAARDLELTPADVSDLRIRKKQRLFDMRHRKDHYTAGTYYFMHRIYKQEGEDGILRFLKDLDMERLYTLFTYDPSYRLIQDSPQLFEAYLTKTGDARLREGVDALAAYLAGQPASPGDAAGLQDILRRVNVSALARIARLYIKKSVAESDPSIYRGFIGRIARLDAKTAENLPDYP